MKEENQSNIIIYQSEDGKTHLEVRLDDKTVWLTQQQMSDLYQTSRTNVVEHIKHIYEEGELDEEATCRKLRQVRTEGSRQVERELPFYNLDMIISLGYRIKSIIATNFRQWATAMQQPLIMTRGLINLSNSSRLCRISCTLRLTDIPLQRLSMNVQMQISQ